MHFLKTATVGYYTHKAEWPALLRRIKKKGKLFHDLNSSHIFILCTELTLVVMLLACLVCHMSFKA